MKSLKQYDVWIAVLWEMGGCRRDGVPPRSSRDLVVHLENGGHLTKRKIHVS